MHRICEAGKCKVPSGWSSKSLRHRSVQGDGRLPDQCHAGLDQYGKHCVVFSFNGEGANRMLQLTSSHMPDPAGQDERTRHRADGYLQSAPAIRGAISDRGEITGDFSEQEVKDLSEILTAVALPAALDRTPVNEVLTGPTLGCRHD